MVQIIRAPDRKKSIEELMGSGLGSGISSGADMGMQMYLKDIQSKKEAEAQEKLLKLKGQESRSLQELKNQQQTNKSKQELETEGRDFNTIKDTFGEKFANVWKSSPVGGRTELLKQALETTLRGDNIDNLLKNVSNEPNQFNQPKQQSSISSSENKPLQLKNGKVPKDFQWPDYSKRPLGYTPKDWINEKSTWRKENSPVFQENKTKLKSNITDELAIKN